MQMSQDQAGYHYYPGMSQEQANELEQMQTDQARYKSLMHHRECPVTPGRDYFFSDDGASSSHPPPTEDPSRTPPPVDPTDGLRRSQRPRVDTSRFSHSQYPDHIVYAQHRP